MLSSGNYKQPKISYSSGCRIKKSKILFLQTKKMTTLDGRIKTKNPQEKRL